jgi:hypothetical protein
LNHGTVLALVYAAAATAVCAGREPKPTTTTVSEPPVKSFALYTLSRAQGVPPEAREALERVRAFLDEEESRGVAMKVQVTRIGIEGETRLCAEFEDGAAGGAAFRRASGIVEGVDLVNLVVEPCGGSERRRND